MPDTVNLYAAKTHLSELVDRAAAGEEIVIAKAGKPKAKLVPYRPPQKKAPAGSEPARAHLYRGRFRWSAPGRDTEVFRVRLVRLLIDTHVLLWADERPRSIRADLRAVLVDPASEIFVSAARV